MRTSPSLTIIDQDVQWQAPPLEVPDEASHGLQRGQVQIDELHWEKMGTDTNTRGAIVSG